MDTTGAQNKIEQRLSWSWLLHVLSHISYKFCWSSATSSRISDGKSPEPGSPKTRVSLTKVELKPVFLCPCYLPLHWLCCIGRPKL